MLSLKSSDDTSITRETNEEPNHKATSIDALETAI